MLKEIPVSWPYSCADPEIFMRGGPTKMLIFGHRRGGSNPLKIPKGVRIPGPPPSGSVHDTFGSFC